MTKVILGTASLFAVDSTPMRYLRSQQQVRDDGRDELQVTLMLAGDALVEQAGRVAHARDGDMVLYDSASPFDLHFPGAHRSLTFKLSTRLLASRLPGIRDLTATSFTSQAGIAVFRSMLETTINVAPSLRPQSMALMLPSLIDMLVLSIKESGADPSPDVAHRRARTLGDVQGWMLEHLDNGELDIQAVAKAKGVTPRTLNRLFASQGTTAIGWLREQRLNKAYALLAQGAARNVTECCFMCGFNEINHFGRSFKEKFGQRPIDVLRGQLPGQN